MKGLPCLGEQLRLCEEDDTQQEVVPYRLPKLSPREEQARPPPSSPPGDEHSATYTRYGYQDRENRYRTFRTKIICKGLNQFIILSLKLFHFKISVIYSEFIEPKAFSKSIKTISYSEFRLGISIIRHLVTCQLKVVEETGVPCETRCRTSSHWHFSHNFNETKTQKNISYRQLCFPAL